MKWLDFAKISVYYEYLLLIPFNAPGTTSSRQFSSHVASITFG